MAGSKTFLEPILKETVAGIDTSIQSMNENLDEVKEAIQPIPTKVDEQISVLNDVVTATQATVLELQDVVNTIGKTATDVTLKEASDSEIGMVLNTFTSAGPISPTISYITQNETITLKTAASGTAKIIIKPQRISFDNITDYVAVTFSYLVTITKNGSALVTRAQIDTTNGVNRVECPYSKNFNQYSYSITFNKGDTFTIKTEMSKKSNSGNVGVTNFNFSPIDEDNDFVVGFEIVDLMNEPIVLS